MMKKLFFILAVLLLAGLLVACTTGTGGYTADNCPNHGHDRLGDGVCDNCGERYPCATHTDNNEDGTCDWCGTVFRTYTSTSAPATTAPVTTTPPLSSAPFYIEANGSTVVASGGEASFSFSVRSDEVLQGSVEFVVSSSRGEFVLTTPTFMPPADLEGVMTVRARINGRYSENAISVKILHKGSEIAQNLAEAMQGIVPYLGLSLDIGISPELASEYTVEDAEGLVAIGEDGKLCFVGIPGRSITLTVVDSLGNTVAQWACGFTTGGVAAAIRSSLIESGLISSNSTNVTASLLAEVKRLTLPTLTPTEELCAIALLTGLEEIDFNGCALERLEFLKAHPTVKTVKLNGATFDLSDNGLAVGNVLKSLPALKQVDLTASYGGLNRYLFDTLATMTANGRITLVPYRNAAAPIDASTVDAFSSTVFFSLEEIANAVRGVADGCITPAAGQCSVIISLPATDKNTNRSIRTAASATVVELYGAKQCYYYTPIEVGGIGGGTVALGLYDYDIRAPYGKEAICSYSNLILRVGVGGSWLHGANWYPIDGGGYYGPTSALFVNGDLSIIETLGSLHLYGGYGRLGDDGVDGDTSDPDFLSSPKRGKAGDDGAPAVYVSGTLTVTATNIVAQGGDGGAGGDGGDAGFDLMDSYNYGLNGGHGGDGGNGGAAFKCHKTTAATLTLLRSMDVTGGRGGSGGDGGAGKLAGKDGTPGDGGDNGDAVFYTTLVAGTATPRR